MEIVLQFLNSVYPLSPQLLDYLERNLKTRDLPRKAYLLRAGHICRQVYFVQKGLLRCYYEKDGHEISSWFMKEGDIMISVESFYQQRSSYESIQALEESTLHYLEYNELQHLYRQYPEFNYIGRVLTEKYYCLSERRLYAIRMQRAQERYDYLLEHHPELVLRVPAKYLASYLGITEVTMSKIRSRG
jgi:CRP/FNR family transcriptional regulator, anaerobic regulatory protein